MAEIRLAAASYPVEAHWCSYLISPTTKECRSFFMPVAWGATAVRSALVALKMLLICVSRLLHIFTEISKSGRRSVFFPSTLSNRRYVSLGSMVGFFFANLRRLQTSGKKNAIINSE